MKKYLILTLGMLISGLAFGQTYLTESFEGTWSGSPGTAPSGWYNIHTTGGATQKYWAKNTWGGSAWSPAGHGTPTTPTGAYDGTSVAWYDDYYASSGQKDQISTENIDLSASTNPRVTFYLAINASSSVTIKLRGSNDGGSSWADIQTITKPGVAWTKIAVTIPGSYKVANARFGIEITATYGNYDVWMDKFVIEEAPSPLTGIKTIKASGGDYASFTAAINALNDAGVGTGGVIFNVDADLVTTEDCPAITATGTLSNPITFQKSGSGANPIIKPTGTTATNDAGIKIAGGDYITFDGIDIAINTGSAVEYGYYIYNASATNGAQNNTIKNTKITLNRTKTSSVGIYQYTAVTPTNQGTGNNNNNKYYNFTIENVYKGIYLRGSGATYYDSDCEIGVTGSGTSTIGASSANDIGNGSTTTAGIHLSRQGGVKVFNTEIRNVNVTSSVIAYGIYLENAQGTASEIYNNNIHDIKSTSTSTSSVVYGILANVNSGSTANIYNNFISAISHGITTASSTMVARGIGCHISATTGTVNLYYNSVRMELGAAATNAAFYMQSGTVNMKNNVFSNFSTAGATSFRYCAYVSSGTLNNSNYNDFYINTSGTNNHVGYYSSATRNTLANWQSATSKDGNSKNADPVFTSATDLHSASPDLNGAGIPISIANSDALNITTDIDGATRSATTPDIGADEFSLLPACTTPVSPADLAIDVAQTTSLSWNTAPNATGYKLYFGTDNPPTNIVNGTSQPGTTYIPASNLDPLTTYYWKVVPGSDAGDASGCTIWSFTTQAAAPTLSVTSPLSPFGNTCVGTTSGAQSFTINGINLTSDITINALSDYSYCLTSGGTYTSTLVVSPVGGAISNQVIYVKFSPDTAGVISGNIDMTGGGLSSTVSQAATGTGVASLGGTYTVGSGGNYTSLTGAGGLFADINAKCVTGNITATIVSDLTEDGSNALNQFNEEGTGGGYTLTIQPDGTTPRIISGTYTGGLIRLNGADRVAFDGRFSGSGNYLTFQNNGTSTNSAVFQLISLGAGSGATNNTIRNCTISGGSNTVSSFFDIFLGSASISTTGTGADNNDNSIIDNVLTKSYYGIFARGVASTGLLTGLVISGNTIGADVATDYVTYMGVTIQNATAPEINNNHIYNLQVSTTLNNVSIDLGQNVTNALVNANEIHGMRSTSTSGYGCYGINISSSNGTSNIQIVNNVIYDLINDGDGTSTTYNPFGIRITGGTDHKVYYNSVNLYGSFINATTADYSAALLITSSSATGLDIRDNIFVNSMTGGSGSKCFAVYAVTGTTFGTIDYNDYYVSGTNGVFGYLGADIADLAAWKGATSQDASSISADPLFTSNSNLLPQSGSPLISAATPIAGVTEDIDGVTRHATMPTMGAYEIVLPACTGAVGGTATANGTDTYCGPGTPNITCSGYSTGDISTYQWQYSNDNFASDVNDFTGQTNPAALTTGVVSATTYYRLKVTCNSGLATDYSNVITITIKPVPTASASSNSPLCAGEDMDLTGTTDIGTSFSWTGPNSFTSSDQSPTITGATTAASGTYSFTATFDGCTSTAGTTIVTVSPLPTGVTASASSASVCSGVAFDLYANYNPSNTILDPTGNGGFETGGTFALNNWTVLNGTYNNWFVGTAAGVQGGVNAAYAGTNFVGTANASVNHFYADYVIPAGSTDINLNFYLKMPLIDNTYDYLYVYYTSTSNTPAVGTVPSSGYTQLLAYTTPALANYTLQSFTLPNGLAGTTVRLVFTYKCDGASPYAVPAVDNISLTASNSALTFSWTSDPAGFTSTDQNPTGVTQTVETEYFVTAENSSGCTTTTSTTVGVTAGATITADPTNQVKCASENVSFTVTASGPGLTYQWRKGGSNIDPVANPSAATSTLTLNNVSSADAASYDVVVQAVCGAPVTSNAATLTVNPVPTATPSSNSPVCTGSTLTLTGTTDIGTTYAWTGPNSFTSSDQNPTITGVTSAASGTYSFTATLNGCTSVAGTTSVTVNLSPVNVTASASSNTICQGSTTNLFSGADCGTSTLNFTEGFESWPPSGWTFINAGLGNDWASSTTAHSGSKSMSYTYNSDYDANAWGITSGLSLSAGTTYTITFWYKVHSSSYPEKLKVTIGNDATVVAQSTTLWDNNGGASLNNTTWAQGTTTFTPSSSGIYYFGFNCYSDADEYYLYVDDVAISGTTTINCSYSWTSDPAGFTSTDQNPANVAPNATTDYLVTVQNSYNCTASASTNVVVDNPSAGGTITPSSATINGGQSTGNLDLSSYTGSIVKWQRNFALMGWSDIPSTAGLTTYAEVPSSSGSWQYRAVVQNGVCAEAYSSVSTITVNTLGLTTFSGAVDSDWNTSGNWDNGVPGAYLNAYIPANKLLEVNTAASKCYNLTIEPLGMLTVNNGADLQVAGTMTVQASATGMGSVIDNGTLTTGSNVIQRWVSTNGTSRWEYVSAPVAAASSSLFTSATRSLWYANETLNAWASITNASPANLSVMKGYVRKFVQGEGDGNTTVNFTGSLNTGAKSIALTRTESAPGAQHGWNLVGNPYPSTMDWDAVNGWTKTNVDDGIYFRTNGNFASYVAGVGTNGGTKYIPPMQAFWIRVTSGQTSGTLGSDNDARIHHDHNIYKSYPALDNNLSLTVTNMNNNMSDETYLRFGSYATDGFDGAYDAFKMQGADSIYPQIYTNIDGTDDLSINSRNTLLGELVIPLGFTTFVTGQFTFNADMVSTFTSNGNTVYMKDLFTGNTQNLALNNAYQFTSGIAGGLNRFVLHFNPATVSINEVTGNTIQIYSHKNEIFISGDEILDGEVYIYDMPGKLVLSQKISGVKNTSVTLNTAGGVYIVKYISAEESSARRVYINQ